MGLLVFELESSEHREGQPSGPPRMAMETSRRRRSPPPSLTVPPDITSWTSPSCRPEPFRVARGNAREPRSERPRLDVGALPGGRLARRAPSGRSPRLSWFRTREAQTVNPPNPSCGTLRWLPGGLAQRWKNARGKRKKERKEEKDGWRISHGPASGDASELTSPP